MTKKNPAAFATGARTNRNFYKIMYVCLLLKICLKDYFFLQAQMSLPCALKSWNSAAAVNSASVEEFRPVSQES